MSLESLDGTRRAESQINTARRKLVGTNGLGLPVDMSQMALVSHDGSGTSLNDS